MQSRDTPVVTWLRDVDCCNVACTWCTMHDTDTITRKTSILRCTVVSLANACTRRLLPASLCACVEQLPAATFGFRLRDVAAKSTNRDGPILIVIHWEPELRGTAAEIWERWNTTAIFLLSNDRTLCGRQQSYLSIHMNNFIHRNKYSNKTKNNNMYNNKIYRYIAYATSLCSGTPRRITVTWNSIIKSEIGYQWHIVNLYSPY